MDRHEQALALPPVVRAALEQSFSEPRSALSASEDAIAAWLIETGRSR